MVEHSLNIAPAVRDASDLGFVIGGAVDHKVVAHWIDSDVCTIFWATRPEVGVASELVERLVEGSPVSASLSNTRLLLGVGTYGSDVSVRVWRDDEAELTGRHRGGAVRLADRRPRPPARSRPSPMR